MNLITFNKRGSLPLHLQITNILKEEIQHGTYTDKMPPEVQLMERFHVSRATVRQAVGTLIDEGILETRQGIGTFIARRHVEEWLGSLRTYIDVIKDMGMVPSIKVLGQGVAKHPKEVVKKLGADRFYFTHRLRLADGIPLVVEKQYYPLAIGIELAKYDLNNVSTYDVLETKMGQILGEARQLISGVVPTDEEKKLLNIDAKNCCVLLLERFVNNQSGELLEYERSVYRADMYVFNITLTRRR